MSRWVACLLLLGSFFAGVTSMQKIFSALEKSYPREIPPFQFMAHFSVFTGSKAKPYGDTQAVVGPKGRLDYRCAVDDCEDEDDYIPSRLLPEEKAAMDPATWSNECSRQHNYYRKKHGVPRLVHNETIRLSAQEWADHLAAQPKGTRLEHRPNNKYGQNIFAMWSSSPRFTVDPQAPVDSWYGEIKDYNYANPGFSKKTGHFTQVVWKSTTNVGCGRSYAASRNTYFVVCEYLPPGNVQSQFRENVLPVISN